jgi:hypothetical protein
MKILEIPRIKTFFIRTRLENLGFSSTFAEGVKFIVLCLEAKHEAIRK